MNSIIKSYGISLLALILLLSACSSPEEKRNTFMEHGKKFEEQGDLIKARLEYKNAVQVDPKCVDCLTQLGQTEFKLKNLRGAYAAYVKASELAPDNIEIKIELGKILISGRAGRQAEELAQEILKRDPDNFEARIIRAIAYAQQRGRIPEALKELEKIRNEFPDRDEGYVVAANILIFKKKFNEAEAVLKEALNHVKEKTPVYKSLMKMYAAQKKWDRALEYARLYYDSKPENVPPASSHATLAQLYARMGKIDDAEKEWAQALELSGYDRELVITYAQFLIRQKKIDKAKEFLKKQLSANPDDTELRISLAKILASTNEGDEALQLIQQGYDEKLEKPERLKLLDTEALINFRLGRFDRALELTEEVLKENPNDLPALSLQAKIALIRHKGEEAVSILRRLVEEEPDNINYKLYLAQAHAINGEFKLAEDQLRTVLKKNPKKLAIWEALIKLKLAEKDIAGASKAASEAIAHLPDSAPLHNMQGIILWMRKDLNGAEQSFRKAMELAPEWLIPYKNLATLKLQTGDPAEAEKTFEEAAKRYPDAPGPQILLATLFEQRGKPERAIEIYENLLKKYPKSTILMNNLAFLIADRDSSPATLQRARKLINSAIHGYETPPPTFLDTKAWIEFKAGHLDHALEIINQALSTSPDNPTLLYHQAEILHAQGKKDEALKAVKKAIENGAGHFPEKKKAEALLKSLEQ